MWIYPASMKAQVAAMETDAKEPAKLDEAAYRKHLGDCITAKGRPLQLEDAIARTLDYLVSQGEREDAVRAREMVLAAQAEWNPAPAVERVRP
jgi:hypothetical protein